MWVLRNGEFSIVQYSFCIGAALPVVHQYTKKHPFLARYADNFYLKAAPTANIIHLWKMFHVKQSFKAYDAGRI
jgi:hypothetical protein